MCHAQLRLTNAKGSALICPLLVDEGRPWVLLVIVRYLGVQLFGSACVDALVLAFDPVAILHSFE